MKWFKAAVIGALGSLVMFALMMLGIHGTGIAPFNLPPSAAFLEQLGLRVGPLPLLVHFGYGATWSMVLIALYGADTDVRAGLTLATVLWLFMMLVYSPLIGWGVFGFGGAGHTLSPSAPLYLGSPIKYIGATLLLHLIYGSIIGGLNPAWIELGAAEGASA
ncbi:MAG: hypothetical protein ABEL97_15875 [Salinibacter sp.]